MFGEWKYIGKDVHTDNVPEWVLKIATDYRLSHTCYDRVIYIKGKSWMYKVCFEMITQGKTKARYYKKLRKKE